MNKLKWNYFREGNLKGAYLYTTKEYVELLYVNGDTDKEMIDAISDRDPAGKVIFDVGAFIGASSLVFSKLVGPKGKVLAFEPNPYNLHRIRRNIKKNTHIKNIIVSPIALSNNNDKTNMLLSKSIDNGHSSTSRLFGAHSTVSNENLPEGFFELKVKNNRLDDYVFKKGIIPNIIKIDIEGAEHTMLEGSIKTLKKYHPDLYVELHSEYCALKCCEILKRYKYSLMVLKEEKDNRIMIQAIYERKLKHYHRLLLNSIKTDGLVETLKKIKRKLLKF